MKVTDIRRETCRARAAGTAVLVLVLTPAVRAADLLDFSPVRSPIAAACEGKGAETPMPADPRTLVTPEVLGDVRRFVHFNAYWIDVHEPGEPFRDHPLRRPANCAEWHERVEIGRRYVRDHDAFIPFGSVEGYRNLWRVWGLEEKPADFEAQVQKRYGFFPNPNPDPDGLPLGLTRAAVGGPTSPNDGVTISCAACHQSWHGTGADGGPGFLAGRSNDQFDASLILVDMLQADSRPLDAVGKLVGGFFPYPFSAGRGISSALGPIDFLGALYDMHTLDYSPGLEVFPAHGASGQVNPPDWWRISHKTRVFQGALSSDNVRSAMALTVANPYIPGAAKRAMEADFENVAAYLESLSPPPYPTGLDDIDLTLAAKGAELFHERDLWAGVVAERKHNVPKPPTNGSCSGCHGVYSPAYADDPRWLPDPGLKGIAAYTVPLGIIGTDPARSNIVTEEMKVMWNTSWWGYVELNPAADGRTPTTAERVLNDYSRGALGLPEGPNVWSNLPPGYEAAPLYGIWASAPYFHNGSVPTVWDVLDPDRRPAVWRRVLTTEPGQQGFDYGLEDTVYDFAKLGWKVERLDCDVAVPELPTATCSPGMSPKQTLFATTSNVAGPYLWAGYQVPAPITEEEVKSRLIYNTHQYSLGNQGHEFTRALDDEQRKAIIEYLKTL